MDKIEVQAAEPTDIPTIRQLANEIWWPTYRDLLPHGQISLMLELMYADTALRDQLRKGQQFALAKQAGNAVGFVGFQHKLSLSLMRIEKLYVLPSEQGKGIGKRLIDHVAALASPAGLKALELNVYRRNPAKNFYERQGFTVIAEVQIPYHGYVLEDYIMQKPLISSFLS